MSLRKQWVQRLVASSYSVNCDGTFVAMGRAIPSLAVSGEWRHYQRRLPRNWYVSGAQA